MRNSVRYSVAIMGLTTTFAVALPYAAEARTFYCGSEDVQCLIFAINDANADTQEKSTIWLEQGGTYTLTTVNNNIDGPNGLPPITGDLTIRVKGNGTATLTGSDTNPAPVGTFRLLDVAATGHLTLRGLVVANARAPFNQGGGLLNNGGEVTLIRTVFSGNNAGGAGGGLLNLGGVVTINKSTFVSNSSQSGAGALENEGGHISIIESTINRNESKGPRPAGAVGNSGTLTIFRSRITQNSSVSATAGLLASGGSVWISETTFAGNAAHGAVALYVTGGTVFVTESAFVKNVSTLSVVGVSDGGALEVTNSTFAKNADGSGVIGNTGVLVLTNTTFGENIPTSLGIRPVLISGAGARTILQNTILSHDADFTQDCVGPGPVISLGNNIFGDPTGCDITRQPGDLTSDPGLDQLTDDGKPGHPHFTLLPTSPAIGAGNIDVCPSEDQLDRPRHGRCDIGAIEFRRHERDKNDDGGVALNFRSLPSEQGWTFSTSAGTPEHDVFSVDGTTLRQNSLGIVDDPKYVWNGAVERAPFDLRFRARLTEFDGPFPDAFAFSVLLGTGDFFVYVGLGPGFVTIEENVKTVQTVFIDTSQSHDYLLLGDPEAGGYSFFVDGTEVLSRTIGHNALGTSFLTIGDRVLGGGPGSSISPIGARAELSVFVFDVIRSH